MDFEAFLPLLVVFLLLILPPLTRSSKSKKKAGGAGTAAKQAAPRAEEAPAAAPARPEPMRPAAAVPAQDDSVWRGSLDAETGEGEDPCHEEQLSVRPAAYEDSPEPAAAPGLVLHWTGSDIARGFVMGEILKRK